MRTAAVGTRLCALLLVLAALAVLTVGHAPSARADVPPVLVSPNSPARPAAFTAGETRRLLFQGLNGQVITITTSAGTFADPCALRMQLRNPAGAPRGESVCAGVGAEIGPITLGTNGLFRVDLEAGGSPGSVSVAITSTPAKLSITPGAEAFPVRIGAGGTVNLAFGVLAGQQIGGATSPADDCSTKVSLVDAAGAAQGAEVCPGALVGSVTAASTGLHRLRLRNTGAAPVTLQVEVFVADSPTLVLHAPETLERTLQSGESVEFGVAVRSGNFLTIVSNGVAIAGGVTLIAPDGAETPMPSFNPRGVSTVVARTALYRVRITNTGPLVMDRAGFSVLMGVHPQRSGRIGGPPESFSLPPGGRFTLTFEGVAGQSVGVGYPVDTFSRCVSLIRPDGTTTRQSCGRSNFTRIFPSKLDASGTWSLVFQSFSDFPMFNQSVSVGSAPDPTVIAIGGGGSLRYSSAGESSYFEFPATIGQQLVVTVSRTFYDCGFAVNTCTCPGPSLPVDEGAQAEPYCPTAVELVDPTGAVAPGRTVTTSRFPEAEPLYIRSTITSTGLWRVRAVGAAPGWIEIGVVDAPDATAAVSLDTPVDAITTKIGQRAVLSFPVVTGHRYGLVFVGTSTDGGDPGGQFIQPDGSSSVKGLLSEEIRFIGPMRASSTGTGRVILLHPSGTEFTARVKVVEVGDLQPIVTPVSMGVTSKIVRTDPTQISRFTFTGAVGQRISALVSSFSYPNPVKLRFRSGDRVLAERTVSATSPFVDPVRLDAAGTWTVEIDAPRADVGGLAVLLRSVTDIVSTMVLDGNTRSFTLTQPGQRALFAFVLSGSARFQVVVTGATDPTMRLRVLRSDGTELGSCVSGFRGATSWFCPVMTTSPPKTLTVAIDPAGTTLLGATLRIRSIT